MMSEFKVTNSDKILGLKIIQPVIFNDKRGEYICTFNEDTHKFYDADNKPIRFVEDDISCSRRGVLRGLHGDTKTWKLIQNLVGEIFFAALDMRKNSPTYLQYECFTLGEKSRLQILIPAGCANGHLCLSEACAFSYKQSEIYKGPEKQFTIAWNDPKIKIPWPISNPILSQRDSSAKFLGD